MVKCFCSLASWVPYMLELEINTMIPIHTFMQNKPERAYRTDWQLLFLVFCFEGQRPTRRPFLRPSLRRGSAPTKCRGRVKSPYISGPLHSEEECGRGLEQVLVIQVSLFRDVYSVLRLSHSFWKLVESPTTPRINYGRVGIGQVVFDGLWPSAVIHLSVLLIRGYSPTADTRKSFLAYTSQKNIC